MTVKDIIDLVRGLSGDLVRKKYPLIVLVSFLNEALTKICTELYLYKETNTQSTVAGTQSYTLPNNVIKITSVKIDDTERDDYTTNGNTITFSDEIITSGTNNIVIEYYSVPQYTVDYYYMPIIGTAGWIVEVSKIGDIAEAYIPEIKIPTTYYDLITDYMLYKIYLNEGNKIAYDKLKLFEMGVKHARVLEDRKVTRDVRFKIQ